VKKGRFVALDEEAPEMAMPSKEPYYPTAHLPKSIPGLEKVGQTAVVKMRVRVSSIEKRKGRNTTGLELLGIACEDNG